MRAKPTTLRPVSSRKDRLWNRSTKDWLIRVVTFVIFITAWQWYASGVSKTLLATPSAVMASMYHLVIEDNVILPAAWITLSALLSGFSLAVVLGVGIGLLMGRVRLIERMLDPYVTFLYAVPSIVFVPLILAWVGLGIKLRIVLVVLAAVFPVIVNTMVGVKQVPGNYTEVGRVFCASERQVMRTIVLPYALPYIFIGLRQALMQSLVMVVVAELLVAITGLGGLMITYSNYFKTANLFVPLLFIMTASLILTSLLRRLGDRLAHWGQQDR